MVKFFLFLVSAQETWSVLTSQIRRRVGVVAKETTVAALGSYDCTRPEAECEVSSGETVLTVDGAPIRGGHPSRSGRAPCCSSEGRSSRCTAPCMRTRDRGWGDHGVITRC